MIINSTLINKGFSASSELVGVSGSPPEGEGPAALSLREFKSLPLHYIRVNTVVMGVRQKVK